jgi:hypothetical protein
MSGRPSGLQLVAKQCRADERRRKSLLIRKSPGSKYRSLWHSIGLPAMITEPDGYELRFFEWIGTIYAFS